MSLPAVLFVVLLSSAALMVALHFAWASPKTDPIKLYPNKSKRLSARQLAVNVGFNALLTGGTAVAVSLGLRHLVVSDAPAAWTTVAFEALATLLLYDFLYYLMHRYLFHEWTLLRSVHVVHHTNKFPTSFESLYGHPLENFLGVSLLMTCTMIVGPVSLPAFAVIFAVFSWFNLLIHSGLDFRQPGLRVFAFLARKHARHHASMRAGNYASITPLPDLLFRTHE
jgi:sterol desaturase/sphingolipid hydroxylase (fatty acid hydroxylase superfamily)